MAELSRFCPVHPDRPAIGQCVITHEPMCAECSTPYQGVNYSKTGLARHLASIKEGQRPARRGRKLVVLLALAVGPGFCASWYGVQITGRALMRQIEGPREGTPP